MSYWERRRPVRRVRAIEEADIAREAIALLDEGGVRAVTARAVAERVGVAAASLYSRIGSVDDMLDLALDSALGRDPGVDWAAEDPRALMLTWFHHLSRHPWAAIVVGLRAPRGPHYLRLSERLCELLVLEGDDDPLSTAYAMSNFVVGSALTSSAVHGERSAPVDRTLAPTYSRLHAVHDTGAESIVRAGLAALRRPAAT